MPQKKNLPDFLWLALVLQTVLLLSPPVAGASIYAVQPWTDGSVITAEAVVALWANQQASHLIRTRCPCDLDEVNSMDRTVIGNRNDYFQRLSDASLVAALVFPVVLDWREVGFSKEFSEDMIVYAETLTTNEAAVTFAKYGVQRPRPRTYDADPMFLNAAQGYESFYSGHTSTTFAALTSAAMTYSYRHPTTAYWQQWPWQLAAVFGASVAYERVQAGQHFYTDVFAGAAAGVAAGIAIPWLHHTAGGNVSEKGLSSSLAIVPTVGGAFLSWKNRF